MNSLMITDQGRKALGELVSALRHTLKITDWGDFARYLSEQSGTSVKKDALWKVGNANYNKAPSLPIVYALLSQEEFCFLDEARALGGRRISFNDLFRVLTEQLNCYGDETGAGSI
ncbi:MAG: hypothetical protein HC812_13120 [Leptolyngbya sp. RL_3_1]|nr:hypothetical protein [Leptolyngbya sp. RL_3_1]